MFRSLMFAAFAVLVAVPFAAAADEKKDLPKKPTVALSGSIEDDSLIEKAPPTGVIATQKAWDDLIKDWSIKDAPKVDFTKEIIVVVTTVDNKLYVQTELTPEGDLVVTFTVGFRYAMKSINRAGIKTVNGFDIPK
jgi:hypothetical protein